MTTWQMVHTTTYTPTGKASIETDGAGDHTQYKYDPNDRVAIVTDPVSRRVGTVYDAAGEVLCVWRGWNSGTGAPTSCAWTPPGTYPATGPVRYAAYGYGDDGEQKTLLDADNNLTTSTYDSFDRLQKVNYPAAASGAGASNSLDFEVFTYYPTGALATKTLRDGQAITYKYDHIGRMSEKDLPGSTANYVFYGYDGAGRRKSAHFGSTGGSGVDYGYDSAGRMTSENTFGRALTFGLDLAGNRTQLTWPDGNYVTYDVDSLNRVSYIRELGALPEAQLYHYKARVYDPIIGRFLQTDPVGYQDDLNLYAYVYNDPLDRTDPTGNCPSCLVDALVEVAFEAYTGELNNAFSEAFDGHFGALAVSAGKIGIAAASGGVSTVVGARAVSAAVKVAEAVNASRVATAAAKVAATAATQAATSAATKVATNAVEGKPLGEGTGTAAAVGATVRTAGKIAGDKLSDVAAGVGGAAGANAKAVVGVASKVVAGEVKKETQCTIKNNGNAC